MGPFNVKSATVVTAALGGISRANPIEYFMHWRVGFQYPGIRRRLMYKERKSKH